MTSIFSERARMVERNIPDDIRRAAKVIGLAAWLGEPDAWENTIPVIEARLTVPQRKALAYAALRTLDEDAFDDVTVSFYGPQLGEVTLADGTHRPIAPLFNHMDEAALPPPPTGAVGGGGAPHLSAVVVAQSVAPEMVPLPRFLITGWARVWGLRIRAVSGRSWTLQRTYQHQAKGRTK